ncbi:MAG: MlaD family protein [Gammaproteobacteria bacterium]|nr:MlaD family protein [Gammaproteobacteria bacterium]
MKRESINYFVVGVFVLSVLAAFFVVLYRVTGSTGPSDEYYVYYDNVTGIKFGTPVLYEGYQIGQVEEITPERDTAGIRYRITMSVIKDWAIPSDSIARILKSGLLSAISIEIVEGESTTNLQSGATLEGRAAPDLFAAVNSVAAEIEDLSKDSIRPLFDNLNVRVDELGGELHDLTKNSLRPMIDKLSVQLDQPEMIDDLRQLSSKLNQTADRLLLVLDTDNLENINDTLVNLNTASSSANELLNRIEITRQGLDGVLININNLVSDVDGVVEENSEDIKATVMDLKKTLHVVSQHVDAVLHHLEGSSRNIHEFTRQIRENPALLIRGSPQEDTGSQ